MRRVLVALVAALALGTLTMGAAGADSPLGRPCVSKPEFRDLQVGMTREQVTRLIDGRGIHVEIGRPARQYDACGLSAWVVVEFNHRDRVRTFYRIGHD